MSITMSLAKFFHVILRDRAIYLNLEYCPNVKESCTVKFFAKNCKGSSRVHRLIRQDYIINNKIPTAPAYNTAQTDYGLNLNLQIWERNLHYTPKIIALPGTSAFFFKVQIRMNWTRKKASLIGQNNDLGLCNYGDEIDIVSDTKHMFYSCCMAIKIWKIITKLFKKSINFNLDQLVEHIIFLQGNLPVNKHEKKAVTDLHAATLHVLQKIALADSRLTDHSAYEVLYKSIITTIYSNKSICRSEHIYEKIINSLLCCFKSRNLINVFNVS